MTRRNLKNQFLQQAGLSLTHATITPLAGDASARRYDRVRIDKRQYVLMDAPPQSGEAIKPFVDIAKMLAANGYSSPKIYAHDQQNGFLLLEDLGDDLLNSILGDDDAQTDFLYSVAVDFLVDLHQRHFNWSPPYNTDVYAREIALVCDWYIPAASDCTQPDTTALIKAFAMPFAAHQQRPARLGVARLSQRKPALVARSHRHCANGFVGFSRCANGPSCL